MDFRKTRLWGESLHSMVELANKELGHPEDFEERKTEVKLGQVPKQKGTLIGHLNVLNLAPPTKVEHSTRLLPIETVLLAERDAREAKERVESKNPALHQTTEEVVLPSNRPNGTHVRRALIVLVVLAIGGLKLYAKKTVPVAAANAVVQTEPVQEVQRKVEAPAPTLTETVQPTVHQRAAVDALASGDFAAAQHAYAELARGTQGRSPFSEAARILQERSTQKTAP